MRKRLRKKLRVGECKELGFSVDCQLVADISEEAFGLFIDAFIDQAIEANTLLFGGGGKRPCWGGFVTSAKRRGSANEADRTHVQDWLKGRSEVINSTVGPLMDAWK